MRTRPLVLLVLLVLGGSADARRHSKAKAKAKKAQAAVVLTDQAMVASVQRAAWTDALLLGRGPGDQGPVALLRATRDGKGYVLTTVGAPGAGPAKVLVLDPIEGNQARITAHVAPFLDQKDLTDLFVEQSPLMTDGHASTGTHFIVRRNGAALALACRFDGGASSSGKPGAYSGHSVVIEKVAGPRIPTFDVRVDATGSERPGEHQVTVARWEIPPKGQCHQRPGGTSASAR